MITSIVKVMPYVNQNKFRFLSPFFSPISKDICEFFKSVLIGAIYFYYLIFRLQLSQKERPAEVPAGRPPLPRLSKINSPY